MRSRSNKWIMVPVLIYILFFERTSCFFFDNNSKMDKKPLAFFFAGPRGLIRFSNHDSADQRKTCLFGKLNRAFRLVASIQRSQDGAEKGPNVVITCENCDFFTGIICDKHISKSVYTL